MCLLKQRQTLTCLIARAELVYTSQPRKVVIIHFILIKHAVVRTELKHGIRKLTKLGLLWAGHLECVQALIEFKVCLYVCVRGRHT
jgi:hypothetical protein